MTWLPLLVAAQAAHGATAEHAEAALEAPTWLDFLHKQPWWPAWLPVQSAWSLVVILLLTVLCYFGTRKMSRVPRGLQNLLEMGVQGLENFAVGMIGPSGKSFTPFLGTIFIYIAAMNLLGLLPGFASPTANININLSMSLVVFGLVQYHGLRQNGMKYFKHFVGDPWWLFFIMLPLHIISELARPITLAVRLFGNIHGEDIAILSFIALAAALPVYLRWLPLQLPLLALACLTSLVQALIFVSLSSVYISLVNAEHEH